MPISKACSIVMRQLTESEISSYFEAMTSGLMTRALAGDVPSSLDTYTTFISFVQ